MVSEPSVAMYNEQDFSDYLYLAPPFSAGFQPLEPVDEKASSSCTNNTGAETGGAASSPTQRGNEKAERSVSNTSGQNTNDQKAPKMRTSSEGVQDRRPTFVCVEPVTTSQLRHSQHQHHSQRRHSSESHLPMSWWPEPETTAQHEWVERDGGDSPREEDDLEEDYCETFFE